MGTKGRTGWLVRFSIALLAISLTLLGVHYLLFRDLHWLEEYIVFDLAFLPVEVIVVTLILDRLLEARERKERLEKMNMVIGLFFSEIGVGLIREIAGRDRKIEGLRAELSRAGNLSPADYSKLKAILADYHYSPDMRPEDLSRLKELLTTSRGFLVRMLENPTLLEHESFTEALRAVFHLTEELDYRRQFSELPGSDIAHLAGDVSRAYSRLVIEWIDYMQYLKGHYPYLFSLAMRTNPFDLNTTPVVRD
jgi:hypothetical protein